MGCWSRCYNQRWTKPKLDETTWSLALPRVKRESQPGEQGCQVKRRCAFCPHNDQHQRVLRPTRFYIFLCTERFFTVNKISMIFNFLAGLSQGTKCPHHPACVKMKFCSRTMHQVYKMHLLPQKCVHLH